MGDQRDGSRCAVRYVVLSVGSCALNLEKLMYRNVPLWLVLALVLLGLLVLIAFGSLISYAAAGGQHFKFLSKPATAIADIPLNLAKFVAVNNSEPIMAEPREDLPDGFWRNPDAHFVDDGYALIPRFVAKRKRYLILLVRLSDGKVMHEYAPDVAKINALSHLDSSSGLSDHSPQRYSFGHPLLMPDGGLIFHDTSPQVRVDACGRPLWTIDGNFHHSNELGPDGNIWTPSTVLQSKIPHVGEDFKEDAIAEMSPDGRILKRESIAAILERNGLTALWRSRPYDVDPFHLNDIQPVLETGPYWQKGDLFISLHNLAMIMLYRPSTGQILWWRQGPWSNQHDVDILDDHRIQIFDNGVYSENTRPTTQLLKGEYVVNHNRLYVYDFKTGKSESPFETAFAKWDIRTITEGLATSMSNGDMFVEETNYGRVLRLSPDGTVRWRYIAGGARGARYEMGWSRYLDPKADAAGIAAATNARCS